MTTLPSHGDAPHTHEGYSHVIRADGGLGHVAWNHPEFGNRWLHPESEVEAPPHYGVKGVS